MNKIKVLIVDDSALIRQTLSTIISSVTEMEVIGAASDPYIAVSQMKKQKPDVVILDIQMPRMDGLTFLKKIMIQNPIPVVVVSSIAQKDSEVAVEAYRLGAISVIEKPKLGSDLMLKEWKTILIDAILTASKSRLNKFKFTKLIRKNLTLEKPTKQSPSIKVTNSIILIGSSAGGTEVINNILSQLNDNCLPILIVQHMPPFFTSRYSERLNRNSKLLVKEANSGDELQRGVVYVAPGDKHMLLRNNGFNYFVEVNNDEKVNRQRPSVDVLFESALKFTGSNFMAIILSGMGNDGSRGMHKLKSQGTVTIAQNEESSIVYGMPKEAYLSGAADYSLSIESIISKITAFSVRN